MPRPTTKPELLDAATQQFEKMWEMIDSLPVDAQNVVFNFGNEFKGKEAHWKRDKNLRDVYIHLHEWHQLLLSWAPANLAGNPQPFLPSPYNWKNYGDMNIGFWEKHQNTPYEKAVKLVKESHTKVMELIQSFSDTELFQKKHFPWTGSSSLGSYCISATSSHYDWAMKKIKQYQKTAKVS